jgi:hypothetical protein
MPLLLLLLASLLATAEPPAWFTSRSLDAGGRLVGLGAGASLAEARQHGAADLVEQLVVTVFGDAVLTGNERVVGDQVERREELHRVLRSSTTLRDLAGMEVVRQEGAEGAWYVAVGIDRQRFAQECGVRVRELDGVLAAGVGERPAVPTAAWVARMRALFAAAVERETLAAAGRGQGVAIPASALPAEVVRNHLGGLTQMVTLRVSGSAPSLSAALAGASGELGVGIAAGDAPATHAATCSIVRSDATTARGWTKVTLHGEMVISDVTRARIIGRIVTEAAATSTTNADKAAAQAGDELERKAGEALRAQFLLILLRNRSES